MLAGSRSPGFVTAVLPFGPVASVASPALHFQDRIPGSRRMLSFIGSHWLPSAGLGSRVVAPPGAAKGAPRLIRSKQHIA
ncbi:hypothetical protein NDU88_002954 [Pleurodeles waltl]|uniref:Secreted protein n=1 Tax=Pleurodeles waltl TaxID=8319 RepID=A0AAV7QAD4_PLEWA|nr:hypothetical protein NDU88_002954 [Pleurodeles waltl]